MKVQKRNKLHESFDSNKIKRRLEILALGLIEGANLEPLNIDMEKLVRKVSAGTCNNIHTWEIDQLSAEICAGHCTEHPDYAELALRIEISNHHKLNNKAFSEKMALFAKENIISKDIAEIININADLLNKEIDYRRDYALNYFGFKTLKNSYLLKENNLYESPQDMFLRVSIGIHKRDIESALKTYNLMSKKKMIHATPTLFNAGTNSPQLSSCFLLNMKADSIDGIYETLWRCALISKNSGGIGLHITKIRGTGSKIKGTNGTSNGIVPMLKVFDVTAKYVDQGGNKRPGSIAVYIEPWHIDIFSYLDLRKNTGKDEIRARDLFLGLWICDLFMEKVKQDLDWCLFCPNDAVLTLDEYNKYIRVGKSEDSFSRSFSGESIDPNIVARRKMYNLSGLNRSVKKIHKFNNKNKFEDIKVYLYDLWGEEFERAYEYHRKNGKAKKIVKAQVLWKHIVETQIETGNPYILYKDSCNRKNNQSNLGVLKGSNLCTEILQYTSPDEVAVCNLASIALPSFIYKLNHEKQRKSSNEFGKLYNEVFTNETGIFLLDFDELKNVAGVITKNLNKIIDINYYPIEEARISNLKHRPIGIGVQGLADLFAILRLPFECDEAKRINKKIFEVIYYGALEASCHLAECYGVYESFVGSPISKGFLQYDLWNEKNLNLDWTNLRNHIRKYGVRNSLLIAPMPTASTSQILGFNECFEPFTFNIYTRRTLAGDFQIINKYLLADLIRLNLWSYEMKNAIIANDGSIQNITVIPEKVRMLYKTAWEMKMKNILDMAADRAPFIDQSQSLNVFIAEPTYSKITSMHFYGYSKGLKTGMYYLRTKPITTAIQFTVDKDKAKEFKEGSMCKFEDGCLSCSG